MDDEAVELLPPPEGVDMVAWNDQPAFDGDIERSASAVDTLPLLRYAHVRRAVADAIWAIEPSKLFSIIEVLEFRAAGGRMTAEEIRERIGAARPASNRSAGNVAVLPLFGTIAQRMGSMAASSGGTSVEAFTRDFRTLVSDPSIGAIVIEVDSPGGAVDGVPELAAEIYRARGTKPISAVANTLAASAAYWLATAADELVVTPSGLVGSIGVITSHQDRSAAMEQLGIKTTLITAGKFKAEGNPFEPLSDEARADIQATVDTYYGMFTSAVAKHRDVPVESVRSGFGEGRVVDARQAVQLGMADRVATLDDVVAGLARRRTAGPSTTQATMRSERMRAHDRELQLSEALVGVSERTRA